MLIAGSPCRQEVGVVCYCKSGWVYLGEVQAWVYTAILLLVPSCGGGVVDFSYRLLRCRLWVLLVLYPLLCFLSTQAIPGDMSFVVSMEETVLPPRFLVLVSVPISALIVSSVVLLVLWPVAMASLQRLLGMLVVALIAYIEDLLVWCSLRLVLAPILSWRGSVVILCLLVLRLIF